MPLFKYTGTDERYYPALGVVAKPGDVHELADEPGDGRWEPAPGVAPAIAPAPVTAVAESTEVI